MAGQRLPPPLPNAPPADHLGLDSSKILPTVGLNVGRVEAFGCSLIFWDLVGVWAAL